MSNNFDDIEVFEGKSLSSLFKEIYDNQHDKKAQISELVQQLIPLVEGLGDATLLVPLIKEYMELGLKNDEQLVKIAQMVQRVSSGDKKSSSEFDFSSLQGLLDEDKAIQENISEVKVQTEEVSSQIHS